MRDRVLQVWFTAASLASGGARQRRIARIEVDLIGDDVLGWILDYPVTRPDAASTSGIMMTPPKPGFFGLILRAWDDRGCLGQQTAPGGGLAVEVR